MSKFTNKTISIMLIVAMACALLCTAGFAINDTDDNELKFINVYVGDYDLVYGAVIGETTYIPLRAFCEILSDEIVVGWDDETDTASVEWTDLCITATIGDCYFLANGRPLLAEEGVVTIGGSTYVPLNQFASVFSYPVVYNEEREVYDVIIEDYEPIESADSFYNADDLYWLSRVISSEAGNQPFDGKVGVGNVVLNRVSDESYPSTVYGVIFDNKHGVQFSVTTTGAIYNSPNSDSVLAAKLCLEGISTVGDSLYFVNPYAADTGWFSRALTLVAQIGDHNFYA